MKEFEKWDKESALKLSASDYGEDVLNEFAAWLDKRGQYRYWRMEREVQYEYSNGRTASKAIPYLHIEMR